MTTDEMKEVIMRVEAFADGIKNGAQILAKAIVDKMEQQAKLNGTPVPSETNQN